MQNTTITKWFLLIGKVEGYSYLVLLFIAMPLKYIFNIPEFVRPVGSVHGVLFVAFMLLLALHQLVALEHSRLNFKMVLVILIFTQVLAD